MPKPLFSHVLNLRNPVTSTTVSPPSGPAGGDLAGTYPAPAIAPLAVTTAKLAVGAAVYGNAQVGNSLATGSTAGAAETTIASITGRTYRGGIVLVTADITMRTFFPDDNTCVLRLYQDTTVISARNFRGGVQATVGAAGAVVLALAQPAAGTHDFSFRWIRAAGTGNFELVNAQLNLIEFA